MNMFVRILEPVHSVIKRNPFDRFDVTRRPVSEAKDVPAASFDETQDLDRLTGLIALANSQTARVVGITGAKTGVGVTLTTRRLAAAYARFGRKTLLVDASGTIGVAAGKSRFEAAAASLLDHRASIGPHLDKVDLAACPSSARSANGMREQLQSAADEGYAVVVDLPAVFGSEQAALATFTERASACDLVFLVCVSGEMTHKELTRCVETCEVAGVKLGGLILNDWKLAGASLLAT